MSAAEDLAVARRLLEAAAKAGAEEADVLLIDSRSNAIGVAGGALEEAERSESRDAGLRVLVGRAEACVASSDLSDTAIGEMAERAVAMACAAPENPYAGLADPAALAERRGADGLELSDPDEMPAAARLEEIALAGEAAALAVAGVEQVEQASTSWGREHLTVVQSNGFEGAYARSSGSIVVSAIAGTGLGREREYAFENRRYWADLPSAEEIGTRAGERAISRLDPRRPPTGRFPVIFDRRVSSSLVGHVLSAINGRSVARGASWLMEARGERILPAGFEIREDPLIVRGPASRPFDAEGLPTAPRAIVTDGVLQGWVLDLGTARQLELESTANARRGLTSGPGPGVSNIRVTEGETDCAGLMREIGRGLLVTSFIGASINATTGDYSRGAGGFWIEGGEIAYPVNEITLAGNLREMIAGIRPGNDAEMHRAMAVPSLIVEGLTLGA